MALKLSLKPGERAAINGAVIVNGGTRAELVLENRARVLRDADIMQPGEASTPARRIYFPIMMAYLDRAEETARLPEYEARLKEFVAAVTDRQALADCASLAAHVANRDYYKALTVCRRLIDFEETLLDHVL